MGSNEGQQNGGYKILTTKACLFILLLSLLIGTALAGGFVLGWWLHKYHPKNRQLWMVPFGFVLFLTPLFICLSVILPDVCVAKTTSRQDEAFNKNMQTIDPEVPHSLSQLNR